MVQVSDGCASLPFWFAFDIFSCAHSLSMPSACCGSASFCIVYIRQPRHSSYPSTFFRNQAVRTLSLGLRPLWLRALAFDVFGVVSLLFSIRIPRSSAAFTFAFYRIFDLRRRIVSFGLPCLQLHSTSTFLYIPGRSELRPQGRGVGHADKTKQQKQQKQKKKKQKKKKTKKEKPRNNCDAAKAQSLDAPLQHTKLSIYCRYQRV
jgi:hypothetical protein